ncbi:LEA type 2 family protein [Desulfobulbus alkaliphilus]|uniref:LEA type 2 family protein n=1 Tax=Desulfobulbus alkaliphilus TaxID=869814 RepID=UPI0019659F86|nr:LEA type 2 family protein [Desulfobulbus alkaliphilus]MBM9538048.1 LEA type 2 family protein [Desulfobulbus alkaliphilus]
MYYTGILKSFFSFLLVVCCLVFLAGCAGVYGLRDDPRISIADIRVVDAKPMETVFLVQLRILNPNDIPLDLHGIQCDLEIDGRPFASGIAASDQVVPAHGTATIPVQLYASVFDMISSVVDLIRIADPNKAKDKVFSYTLSGTVGIGIQRSRKQIPFTSSGELSLGGFSQMP